MCPVRHIRCWSDFGSRCRILPVRPQSEQVRRVLSSRVPHVVTATASVRYWSDHGSRCRTCTRYAIDGAASYSTTGAGAAVYPVRHIRC